MNKVKSVEAAFEELDQYILTSTSVPIVDHSVQVRNVYNRLKRYVELMDLNNRINSKEGAGAQRDLYNTFIMTLNVEPRVSFTCLNIVLFIFNYFSDSIFSESFAYRFIDRVELAQKQLKAFRYMMHLFIATANPGTRRINLRRVDIVLVAEELNIQLAKDNLIRYYNITTN